MQENIYISVPLWDTRDAVGNPMVKGEDFDGFIELFNEDITIESTNIRFRIKGLGSFSISSDSLRNAIDSLAREQIAILQERDRRSLYGKK